MFKVQGADIGIAQGAQTSSSLVPRVRVAGKHALSNVEGRWGLEPLERLKRLKRDAAKPVSFKAR